MKILWNLSLRFEPLDLYLASLFHWDAESKKTYTSTKLTDPPVSKNIIQTGEKSKLIDAVDK